MRVERSSARQAFERTDNGRGQGVRRELEVRDGDQFAHRNLQRPRNPHKMHHPNILLPPLTDPI